MTREIIEFLPVIFEIVDTRWTRPLLERCTIRYTETDGLLGWNHLSMKLPNKLPFYLLKQSSR